MSRKTAVYLTTAFALLAFFCLAYMFALAGPAWGKGVVGGIGVVFLIAAGLTGLAVKGRR